MSELRRYATLLAPGAAGSTPIVLDLRKAADGRLAGSADWTPVPGDVTVSIDEGTAANITTVPAFAGGRWRLVLTAAELTGKSIVVRIADLDGPAIADTLVEVQTFGNAAAFYPDAYSTLLVGTPGATGLAGDVAGVQGDTNDLQTRLPAALVTGKMDSIASIATDGLSAGSLSASAGAEIADAVWDEPRGTRTTGTFGDFLDMQVSDVTGGGGGGATAAEIADAVWDEPLTAHGAAGTAGEAAAAARAQAFGKWVIAGDALTLYAADGTTVVKTFALSPAGGPYTTRTPA